MSQPTTKTRRSRPHRSSGRRERWELQRILAVMRRAERREQEFLDSFEDVAGTSPTITVVKPAALGPSLITAVRVLHQVGSAIQRASGEVASHG